MAVLFVLHYSAKNRREAFVQWSQSVLGVSVLPRSLEKRAYDLGHLLRKNFDNHMQAPWGSREVVHMRPCRLSVCDHEEWRSTPHPRVQRVSVGYELSWV